MAEGRRGERYAQGPSPSEFERVLRQGHNHEDNLFANFSYDPPKQQGAFRAFTRRNKYKYIASLTASRDKLGRLGSNTSLSSLSGSSQNLLDPNKMLNMQEDARSRRISAEVMKHRLYESVVTSPRRRRFSMRMDYSGAQDAAPVDVAAYSRMVQSMPVTPAHSQNVTPAHSPTANRKFGFGFFSRGTTPHGMTPEEEEPQSPMETGEDSWKGLASLFKPQPKYIPGAKFSPALDDDQDMNEDAENRLSGGNTGAGVGTGAGPSGGMFGAPAQPPGVFLRPMLPPRQKRSRSPSPIAVRGKDLNAMAPSTF